MPENKQNMPKSILLCKYLVLYHFLKWISRFLSYWEKTLCDCIVVFFSLRSFTFCFKPWCLRAVSVSLRRSYWSWRRYFTPAKPRTRTGCCCRTTTAQRSRSTTGSSSPLSLQVRQTERVGRAKLFKWHPLAHDWPLVYGCKHNQRWKKQSEP